MVAAETNQSQLLVQKEFVTAEHEKLIKGKTMEGQLSKFTNLMKGWQYRWFKLDAEEGTLAYFLDKDKIKQPPRGAVYLAGAVIAPSDEDSNSFTVNASNGDIYKLRATDAKERQHWINMIRAVAEFHSSSSAPVQPPPSNFQRSASLGNALSLRSTQSVKLTSSQSPLTDLKRHHTVSHHSPRASRRVFGPNISPTPPNPVKEELKDVKDALNSVDEYHASVVEALENGPHSGDVACTLDENVLMLKATSQAMVNILHQCYTILQHQATDVHTSAQATGLPPGATIEWLAPSQPVGDLGNAETGDCNEVRLSGETSDDEFEDLEDEFLNIRQYENDEIEDIETELESEESMEPHRSMILHILSQLKLGMDLTRVVLPTFVLEKRSLLEMYADFFGHSDLFTRIADGLTAEDRILSVLEFYLTSFHVGRKTSVAKKPYNPIIGETFHCSYDTPNNRSSPQPDDVVKTEGESSDRVNFVAEQVSHHPPISAFYAECPKKRISMNTHIWTKSKFYGMSIGVVNVGEGIISLPNHEEEYVMTFPNAYCRSILTYPWVELGGRTVIKCAKTGYVAIVLFHTKPFYGGTENKVSAEIKHIPSGNIYCRAEGSWDGKMEISFTNEQMPKRIIDIKQLTLSRKRVRSLDKQKESESRKLWQRVTTALKQGDLEAATAGKHSLEERQRMEERQRQAAGVEWKTKLFHKVGDGWWFNHHMVQRSKSRTMSKSL